MFVEPVSTGGFAVVLENFGINTHQAAG